MLWLRNYLKIVFPASTDNGFDVAMLVQTQTSQQEYNNCLTVSGKGPFINVPDDGLRLRWNVELKIFSLFVAVTNQILIEDVLQIVKKVKHMQVCLENMCNFPQFTILSESYLWMISVTLNGMAIPNCIWEARLVQVA